MNPIKTTSALILIAAMACTTAMAQGPQNPHKSGFELGNGLNFSFNEDQYFFKISGMIQPAFAFERMDDNDADYFFNAKRTYFNMSGRALKEKVSFFMQTDFSLASPLLDAWLAYHPTDNITITAGQKQTIANNREMMVMEDLLQFADRSLLSTNFSQTGREMGIYAEWRATAGNVGIVTQGAVTSGDGRNSFGTDSRDVDLGGLKYGGRVDVYPLGFFSPGNELLMADLMHEQELKMVIGFAGSYNDGASNPVGEGHGNFLLYNSRGTTQLPDYRQLYADLLAKYRGFSFLGEYVVATATSLEGIYTDVSATQPLQPTEISQFLALGTSYNAQLGYVTLSGYGFDVSYSAITPEFAENTASIIAETTAWTFGLSRYFKENDLKIQTSLSAISGPQDTNTLMGSLIFQVVF
jgi:hypothetical protein